MSRERQKNEPSDRLAIINDELHKVLCETIQDLLQSSITEEGITEQEIETAREFAELKPDTKAAKELLEFLDSEEVKEVLKSSLPEQEKDSRAN